MIHEREERIDRWGVAPRRPRRRAPILASRAVPLAVPSGRSGKRPGAHTAGGFLGARPINQPTPRTVAVLELVDGERDTADIARELSLEFPMAYHTLLRLSRQGRIDQVGVHGWRRRA